MLRAGHSRWKSPEMGGSGDESRGAERGGRRRRERERRGEEEDLGLAFYMRERLGGLERACGSLLGHP